VRVGIQVPEALKGADLSKQEKDFSHMEPMICGMTPQERRNPHILNARRRQTVDLPKRGWNLGGVGTFGVPAYPAAGCSSPGHPSTLWFQ
jgi:hypothetical protein